MLELNDGGTQVVPTDPPSKPEEKPAPVEKDEGKCALCGFCPVPFGLCIFIWLAILLAVIVIIVILIAVTRPGKCKKCGAKLKKDNTFCPKCGTAQK